MKLVTFDAYIKAKQDYENLKVEIINGDTDTNLAQKKLEVLGNAIDEYMLDYCMRASEAVEWLRNWRHE